MILVAGDENGTLIQKAGKHESHEQADGAPIVRANASDSSGRQRSSGRTTPSCTTASSDIHLTDAKAHQKNQPPAKAGH